MRPPSDIIVVGAGIIGCAVAYELARRGASVRIVDDRPVGMGATQASAGILAPYIEADADGPLLELSVGGHGLGDELRLPGGGQEVVARVSLRSNVPVDHLEIVGNGAVLREIPLAGDRTRADLDVRLPVRTSGWLLLRARSDRAMYPVLDLYPYATTSPIYVTVGGKPARSAGDAEYFLQWIGRLEAAARASTDWNTDGEREHALELMERARREFERRREEG